MATRMGSERKRKGKAPAMVDNCVRRRKPLSDCSNILIPQESSSTVIPKPTPNPAPASRSRTQQVKNSTVASNPRTHSADPTSVPTTPSPGSGRSGHSVFEEVPVPVSSVFKRLRDDLGGERVDAVTKSNSKPRVEKTHGVSSGKEWGKDLGGERVDTVTKSKSKPRVKKNHDVSSGKKSSRDLGGERVDAVTKPNSKPRVKKNHDVSSGKKLSKDLGDERVDAVTKLNSKPRVKKNHGVSSRKESSKDMEEYVRQQKSYFEEIDAFELLVEEVSDEELD